MKIKKKKSQLFRPSEEGQGLVEYALMLVLAAVVVIAIVVCLGIGVISLISRYWTR